MYVNLWIDYKNDSSKGKNPKFIHDNSHWYTHPENILNAGFSSLFTAVNYRVSVYFLVFKIPLLM